MPGKLLGRSVFVNLLGIFAVTIPPERRGSFRDEVRVTKYLPRMKKKKRVPALTSFLGQTFVIAAARFMLARVTAINFRVGPARSRLKRKPGPERREGGTGYLW